MGRALVGSAAGVALVAVAAVGVLMPTSGGSSTEGLSQSDIRLFVEATLLRTWESTELPGDPPEWHLADLEIPPVDSPGNGLSDCVAGVGIHDVAWTWGPDEGYRLHAIEGSEPIAPAVMRKWYGCVAEHPIDSMVAYVLISGEQRAAMFDYQVRQLAPCLTLLGYSIDVPYSREEAIAQQSSAHWSVYESVWRVSGDGTAYDAAVAVCGDPFLPL